MATWNDPSPLANPFTTRSHGNFNTRRAAAGGYIRRVGDKDLAVPNQDIPYNGSPEWWAMQYGNRLKVPNQDIPPGDQTPAAPGRSGFISDRLFKLPDGAVVDYKTGRVFAAPRDSSGYRVIGPGDIGMEDRTQWDSGPTLDELVNNVDKWVRTATPDGGLMPQMDPKSAAYWLMANEEAAKLKASMTDEQKALIAAFEAHFPKSRLVEESRKAPSGRLL